MNKITLLLAFFLTTVFAFNSCGSNNDETVVDEIITETTTEDKTTKSINVDSSKIGWIGEMLGIYKHTGTINLKKSEVTLENGKLIGGSFTANLNSIEATDNNFDEEKPKEKLIGHLKSADFFDVENYPEATFVVTGHKDNMVLGTMTIRGIENEETFENIVIDGNKITGNLTFDRKKYNVAFDMTAQDLIISDKVTLEIELYTNN